MKIRSESRKRPNNSSLSRACIWSEIFLPVSYTHLLPDGKVVAMYGELGSGKTAFVRGMARGMGLTCRVSSPTFTIVNEYEGPRELIHFDMYRLGSADELFDICLLYTSILYLLCCMVVGFSAQRPRCRESCVLWIFAVPLNFAKLKQPLWQRCLLYTSLYPQYYQSE